MKMGVRREGTLSGAVVAADEDEAALECGDTCGDGTAVRRLFRAVRTLRHQHLQKQWKTLKIVNKFRNDKDYDKTQKHSCPRYLGTESTERTRDGRGTIKERIGMI